MLDSEVFGNRRFHLDGPPPQPDLRSGSPTPATPESLYDSSSGTVTKNDESTNAGDPGVRHVAMVFQHLANAEDELTQLSSLLPEVTPLCSDAINTLRQAIPQALANMQSGNPMSHAGAQNTVNQLSGVFGGGQQKPAPIAGPSPMAAPPSGAGGVMG